MIRHVWPDNGLNIGNALGRNIALSMIHRISPMFEFKVYTHMFASVYFGKEIRGNAIRGLRNANQTQKMVTIDSALELGQTDLRASKKRVPGPTVFRRYGPHSRKHKRNIRHKHSRNKPKDLAHEILMNIQLCKIVEEHVMNKLGPSALVQPGLVWLNSYFRPLYAIEQAAEVDEYLPW